MHNPIVIEGQMFDWRAGAEAMAHIQRSDGGVNWKAAWYADPGVCSCPRCKRYHWAEGTRQRCTGCGFEYPTHWWSDVARGRDDARLGRDKDAESNAYYCFGYDHFGLVLDSTMFEFEDSPEFKALVEESD